MEIATVNKPTYQVILTSAEAKAIRQYLDNAITYFSFDPDANKLAVGLKEALGSTMGGDE